MFDKFGYMETAAQINELAANLKTEGDNKSIKALAKENGIDEDIATAYIDGLIPFLCDDLSAALGKLDIEAKEVKAEELISDWCEYIRQRCLEDPAMRTHAHINEVGRFPFSHIWGIHKSSIPIYGRRGEGHLYRVLRRSCCDVATGNI